MPFACIFSLIVLFFLCPFYRRENGFLERLNDLPETAQGKWQTWGCPSGPNLFFPPHHSFTEWVIGSLASHTVFVPLVKSGHQMPHGVSLLFLLARSLCLACSLDIILCWVWVSKGVTWLIVCHFEGPQGTTQERVIGPAIEPSSLQHPGDRTAPPPGAVKGAGCIWEALWPQFPLFKMGWMLIVRNLNLFKKYWACTMCLTRAWHFTTRKGQS